MVVLLCSSWGYGQSDLVSDEVMRIRDVEGAIRQNEALLAKYPDSDFVPNVLFQLSELYVRQSQAKYRIAMAAYEEDLKRFDRGELTVEPIVPRISYRKAIDVNYQILKKYPDVPFRDKIIYRLGIFHSEEGNREKAKEYFQQLVFEYPNSPYAPEAYFRIGEYHFDRREFELAAKAYAHLLNKWDNPFFDMALYKLGWSYYNLDRFAEAISTFIYLIEDINLLEEANTEFLGKTKADLRTEAIEYTAMSFSEFGGARKARQFLQTRKQNEYSKLILAKLGEVYQRRNFYAEAIETYETMLDLWPFDSIAPFLQKRIIENYELAGDEEQARLAREKLVRKYGPGTKWLDRVKDAKSRRAALELTEEALFSLGVDAQASAQQNGHRTEYDAAVQYYQEYLAKFPNGRRAAQATFYLAESYYESGLFAEAAKTYYAVVTQFPESEHRQDAAFNRVLSYAALLEKQVPAKPTSVVIENYLGRGETVTVPVENPIQAELLVASNDYVLLFPTGEHWAEVLLKIGESFYSMEQYDLASSAYALIIEKQGRSRFAPKAYTMIAQTAFKKGDYESAEAWYRKLSKAFPDSARYVEKADRMIASSRYKIAEALKEQQKPLEAAREFEKVARISPQPEIAARALYEAAAQYEAAGDKMEAIRAFEEVARRYPDAKVLDEALFKAGMLSEDMQDWRRAVRNYLTLVNRRVESTYGPRALFNAALAYDRLGDAENAAKTFLRYASTYQRDPDQYIESLFRAGMIGYDQKRYNEALKRFRRATAAYQRYARAGQAVESYIPAQAQFMIGEILFEQYRKTKLVPPLKRNLKRKQARFQEVLKAYTEAAKYKVAEWTVAASFRIGEAFEEFADALMTSPRPPNLRGPDLAKYESFLAKQARPLREKALETYRANLRRAEDNNISNDWVARSRNRIAALENRIGLRSEALPRTTAGGGPQLQPMEQQQ
jgi:TolA-binding protein